MAERCKSIAPADSDMAGQQCGNAKGHRGPHTALIATEFITEPPMTRTKRNATKVNVEAQEEVVSALWAFASAQHALDPAKASTTASDGTPVDLNAVGVAMKRIMSAFGFTVQRID